MLQARHFAPPLADLMTKAAVKYLVFDVESAADPLLVAKVRHPGENIDPKAAVEQYRAELMAKYDSDFIPYTFQIPLSIVVGKVSAEFQLLELVALDDPLFRPHILTEHFWRGWEAYRRPTLVSFNGRTFDIPLLELAAFRYGIGLAGWFSWKSRTYDQPRNRYNVEAHLDLHDVLTNHGASRFVGGLNLAANLLGKPGKMDVQGDMVQDLHFAGKLQEINNYCRCDVLDTYFVFLRTQVLLGNLEIKQEQELVAQTKQWLEADAATQPAYRMYLDRWGDWKSPWEEAQSTPSSADDS